jgi:two-component system CheB/CheR fusion protein
LAEDQGEHAIGIILSGAGSDGTLGIKAIKEHGGLVLAQGADHSGPKHSGMPDSAIATGIVDIVAAVDAMPQHLIAYVRSFETLDKAVEKGEGVEAIGRTICAILHDRTGHDFSGYKTRTFYRRIERRMQVLQIPSLNAYVEHLRQSPSEVDRLFRDLLIGVTNFFRDANAFEALEEVVMPRLFEGKTASDTIRVWVPGCATGEEVYSLAIMLREQVERSRSRAKVQLFATDIDEAALSVARSGRYPDTLLQGVSKGRLERFFTAEGTSYVVSKHIRDMCVFSPHSVVRDPPFSRMDLISCRNLLIYLNSELQGRVIPVFHYALKPNGFLFLGTSENLTQHGELFSAVDKKNRIYQRRADGGAVPYLPALFRRYGVPAVMGGEGKVTVERSLRQRVDARVLERYIPPNVVVTRDGDIINYSGGTGKYLEAPPGRPSRSIMAMARRGLRFALRSALHEAIDSGHTAVRDNIAIDTDDKGESVKIVVEPLEQDDHEPLFLVVFQTNSSQRPSAARDRHAIRAWSSSSASCAKCASGCNRPPRNTRPRSRSSNRATKRWSR